MKPEWKDAPEWAKWLAQNGVGFWHWYEKEPTPAKNWNGWMMPDGGKTWFVSIGRWNQNGWKETLESRP